MSTSRRGAALEGFAGDGSGGTYFFCGDGGEERPILYADSEGGATLVAIGVQQLLQLLLVAPWWRDCREFTEEESRELAAEYQDDMPDLVARRDRSARALGLDLPTEAEAITTLHRVATEAGRDFVLVFTPEGTPYERLIGDLTAVITAPAGWAGDVSASSRAPAGRVAAGRPRTRRSG
ncbi:hypothetical protein AB0869_31670 [Micromonospora vinacea]|uniref:hypothetical protein n=1 Tax=Micromonospora vinacea TaxID=709878 RepID=UPI0034553F76